MQIKETIEMLMDPSRKRPEMIEVGYDVYIYNDAQRKYEMAQKDENEKPFLRKVCNVDSFARVVLDENKRRETDAHTSGFRRTVIFGEHGAEFFVDDLQRFKQDKWIFCRTFTHLWKTITEIATGKAMSHKDLIFALDSVRKYIPGYESIHYSISKLRINKKVNFVSNPIFSDGEQRGAFEWEQRVDSNNATEKAVCPSEIPFKGQVVRGSSINYEFSLQLTPILDDENGRIFFAMTLPGIDLVLDQIREDEYAAFCDQVKSLENLLILRNY